MDLEILRDKIKKEVEEACNLDVLESVRIKYLGRKDGELTKILRSLKDLLPEARRLFGIKANELKQELESLFEKKLEELKKISSIKKLDFTKPGKRIEVGHPHPLSKIEEEIRYIFASMNFSVVEGSEIESEYYNFDALNIPADHPARDMWDTFWLRQNEIKNQKSKIKNTERLLLRTHTSPMQIRYMETHKPPFQIIVPGRVFRYEATDATHEINFYQLEGLMVGDNISMANLKFVISVFFKKLFGPDVEFRFRPVYFPFVEPGIEVDIKLSKESGKWLEVLGAGMVHPNVFRAVGYDAKKVQGFAFGVGLDRLAMIKYKIPDVRLLYTGDLRVIKQF